MDFYTDINLYPANFSNSILLWKSHPVLGQIVHKNILLKFCESSDTPLRRSPDCKCSGPFSGVSFGWNGRGTKNWVIWRCQCTWLKNFI